MSILKDGTLLNREQYKITKIIGQGGFGITYLAEEIGYYKNTGFGEEYKPNPNPETVVIKELFYDDICSRDNLTGLITISNLEKKKEFEKLVKNQLDEGKTIRSLKHKNIVRTRDIFEDNNTAYMVMDYIESTDIEKILEQSGAISKEKTLKYIFQILDAVDYIHTKTDKKILHLDISPSNILINKENDDAILIDFGSALSYDTIQNKITSTTSQIVTGRKRHYSPNEQADIDELKFFDATFDTYAIGATLYHMLSGEKPPLSSLISSGKEKVLPPSHFGKDNSISDYLDEVILKAISFWYPNRFKSAQDFSQSLIKEKEYIKKIAEVNKQIANKNTEEALNEVNLIKEYFLETPTIKNIELLLNKELEKSKKEKEFNIFFEQGLELLAKDKYSLAKNYFEKASAIFPDNANLIEKISFCNDKLKEEKANQLEVEFAKAIENKNIALAKSIYTDLVSHSPSSSKNVIFEKQMVQLQNEIESAKSLLNAKTAFAEKKYGEALSLTNSILNYDPNNTSVKEFKAKIEKELEKTIISVPQHNDKNEDTELISEDNSKQEIVNTTKNKKNIIFISLPVIGFFLIAYYIFFNTNSSTQKATPNNNTIIDSTVITKNDSTVISKDTRPVASEVNPSLPNKVSDNKTEEYKDKKQEPSKVHPKEDIKQVNIVDESKYMVYLNRANEIIEKTGGCEECKKEIDKACINSVTDLLNKALIYNPNGKEAKEILKCIKQ